MTHFLRKMVAAWIILGSVSVGFAQQQTPHIPTDPNVRLGKLDNGLTYSIRHNELPEKRADFYIAQKVGSILEEDNQRGLADVYKRQAINSFFEVYTSTISPSSGSPSMRWIAPENTHG